MQLQSASATVIGWYSRDHILKNKIVSQQIYDKKVVQRKNNLKPDNSH